MTNLEFHEDIHGPDFRDDMSDEVRTMMSRLIDRAKSAEKLAEAEREKAECEKKRAESERKRAESAENRVLLAESKIEDLTQLLNSSKAWPIKNSAVSL